MTATRSHQQMATEITTKKQLLEMYAWKLLGFAFAVFNVFMTLSSSLEPIKGYNWIAPRAETIVSSIDTIQTKRDIFPNNFDWQPITVNDSLYSRNVILNFSTAEKTAMALRVLTEVNGQQTFLIPDLMFTLEDVISLCNSSSDSASAPQDEVAKQQHQAMCSILSHRSPADYSIAGRVSELLNRRSRVLENDCDMETTCAISPEIAMRQPYVISRLYEFRHLDSFSIRSVINVSVTDPSAIIASSSSEFWENNNGTANALLWTLAAVKRLEYCDALRNGTDLGSWNMTDINDNWYFRLKPSPPSDASFVAHLFQRFWNEYQYYECVGMYTYDAYHAFKLSSLVALKKRVAGINEVSSILSSSSSSVKTTAEEVMTAARVNDLVDHLLTIDETVCEYPVGDRRISEVISSSITNGTRGLSFFGSSSSSVMTVGWSFKDSRYLRKSGSWATPCLDSVIASLVGRDFPAAYDGTYYYAEPREKYTMRLFNLYSSVKYDAQELSVRWSDGRPTFSISGASKYPQALIPALTPHLPFASSLDHFSSTAVSDILSSMHAIETLSDFEPLTALVEQLDGSMADYQIGRPPPSGVVFSSLVSQLLLSMSSHTINFALGSGRSLMYDDYYVASISQWLNSDTSILVMTTSGSYTDSWPSVGYGKSQLSLLVSAYILMETHFRLSIAELAMLHEKDKPTMKAFLDVARVGKTFVEEQLSTVNSTLDFLGLIWGPALQPSAVAKASEELALGLAEIFQRIDSLVTEHWDMLKGIATGDVPRSIASDLLVIAASGVDMSLVRRQQLIRPDTICHWDRLVLVDNYEQQQVVAYSNASYVTFDSSLGIVSLLAASMISFQMLRYIARFFALAVSMGRGRFLRSLEYTDPVAEVVLNSTSTSLSALFLGLRALLRLYVVDIKLSWQEDAVGFQRLVPIIRKLSVSEDGLLSCVFCLAAVSWIILGFYGVAVRTFFSKGRLHIFPAQLLAFRALPVVGYFIALSWTSTDLVLLRDIAVVLVYSVVVTAYAWIFERRTLHIFTHNSYARLVAKSTILHCIPSTATRLLQAPTAAVSSMMKASTSQQQQGSSSTTGTTQQNLAYINVGVLVSCSFFHQVERIKPHNTGHDCFELILPNGRLVYVDFPRHVIVDREFLLAALLSPLFSFEIDKGVIGGSEMEVEEHTNQQDTTTKTRLADDEKMYFSPHSVSVAQIKPKQHDDQEQARKKFRSTDVFTARQIMTGAQDEITNDSLSQRKHQILSETLNEEISRDVGGETNNNGTQVASTITTTLVPVVVKKKGGRLRDKNRGREQLGASAAFDGWFGPLKTDDNQ